jgi:hypothetical protein
MQFGLGDEEETSFLCESQVRIDAEIYIHAKHIKRKALFWGV